MQVETSVHCSDASSPLRRANKENSDDPKVGRWTAKRVARILNRATGFIDMSRILSALGSHSLMTPLVMSMPCQADVFDDASIPCRAHALNADPSGIGKKEGVF